MTAYRWAELTRGRLARVLPDAVVVLSIGAIEQHGPHLPAGTDSIAVTAITDAAVEVAAERCERDLVLAPNLAYGASDHHLVHGATLSVTHETMTAVLVDVLRSIAVSGGRRVLVVNGHGGNRGPCETAIQVAAVRHGLLAACTDYWAQLEPVDGDPPVPGHAGTFETSLINHLRPELGEPAVPRPAPPAVPGVDGVSWHSAGLWTRIDGYTDDPSAASAARGARWFTKCVETLAVRITGVAGTLSSEEQ